jgi:FkbM family methyltransferase
MIGRLRKMLYRLGWLAPFWEVDRSRYLKRLRRRKANDWRYAAAADAEQFVGGEVVVRLTGIAPPVFIYCDRHWLLEAEIIKAGAFQRYLLTLGSDLICPGSIVLDVGANVGAYGLPWAACHTDVSVHCFEPHPQVRARLARNLALNRPLAGRVAIRVEALSDRTGSATFQAVRSDGGNWGLSALASTDILDVAHADLIEVPMARLDDLFPSGGKSVSLVKVDVQGHELEVLRGAVGILARDRPALILEHEDVLFANGQEAAGRKAMLAKLLGDLGYETLYISRWGADLLTKVDWSRPLNGDLLALPLGRVANGSE